MNVSAITSDGGEPRSFGRDVSRYVVAGERVPSVTEILDLAGVSGIRRLIAVAGEEVVARAAHRGSLVHGYCEVLDLDPEFRLDEVPDSLRGYVAAYRAFRQESAFVPDLIEEAVVSETFRFAGTVDRAGCIGRERLAIDLKTPAVEDPSWRLQTAGYAIAIEESYGVKHTRACLRLLPTGKYKLIRHSDRSDIETFLAAARVAHHRLAHGLAKLED